MDQLKKTIRHHLNVLSQTDQKLRGTLYKFLAKLNDDERAKIISTAFNNQYRCRDKYPQYPYGRPFFFEIELMKELKRIRSIMKKDMESPGTPEVTRLLRGRRIANLEAITQRRRQAKKKEKINQYIPDFLEIRKKGFSYEVIAKYAHQQYGLKVSRETIRKTLLSFRSEEPGINAD